MTNRDVGADNQNDIGEAAVAAVVHFVENAPGRKHSHDCGLARARCHLAGIAQKPFVALLLLIIARIVARNLDTLPKIGSRFREENDRLCSFALRKEQSLLTSMAIPPLQKFECCASHAGMAFVAPCFYALANSIYYLQLNSDAPVGTTVCVGFGFGVAIEIHRGPAP